MPTTCPNNGSSGQFRTAVNPLPTDRTYTGQEQDTTGLMFYHARFYDPALGTFISPDTVVPEPGRVSDYNRFAYVRSNPLKYTDPTGNFTDDEIEAYLQGMYGDLWQKYWDAWMSDSVFWQMLQDADYGNVLYAPTTSLGAGIFGQGNNGTFTFEGSNQLWEFQGYGPYKLTSSNGETVSGYDISMKINEHIVQLHSQRRKTWQQPLYQYGPSGPEYTGFDRKVGYSFMSWSVNFGESDSVPYVLATGLAGSEAATGWLAKLGISVTCPYCAVAGTVLAAGTYANNVQTNHYQLQVDYIDLRPGFCYADPGPRLVPDPLQGLRK